MCSTYGFYRQEYNYKFFATRLTIKQQLSNQRKLRNCQWCKQTSIWLQEDIRVAQNLQNRQYTVKITEYIPDLLSYLMLNNISFRTFNLFFNMVNYLHDCSCCYLHLITESVLNTKIVLLFKTAHYCMLYVLCPYVFHYVSNSDVLEK